MARVELIMPKMGESIMEATILKWSKKVGDTVTQDETILEVATDKVDSEIPSPFNGIVEEILYPENSVVAIGKVIAYISSQDSDNASQQPALKDTSDDLPPTTKIVEEVSKPLALHNLEVENIGSGNRFYSPLVKNIAKEENLSSQELSKIAGSGADGRVTKKDILSYVDSKKSSPTSPSLITMADNRSIVEPPKFESQTLSINPSGGNEIIEMDRMRKLIADHMVMSKHTSPHVTSFIEADVTSIVQWREKNKDEFQKKYGEKITYTPIFIEAIAKAIKDFPMINVSVEGTKIIVKKNINIGMAAALPTGNLIVPVIKNANLLNLSGLTKAVNDLANRARLNKLKPEEIQDGTFTVTNVGTFGNVMGTPIINQPQVAIMAVGAIRKRPAVIETEQGDVIAIRNMMYLSMSYDHRVVDGFLGGSFLKRVGDYLEAFKGENLK